MVLTNVKSCVTTLTGNLKFNNDKFVIREIKLDGEEMPSANEQVACMVCTSNDKTKN
jgi:hypothetical protein|nr:MAG TPA: hypothetical protein [Caudoviricetes sp.]